MKLVKILLDAFATLIKRMKPVTVSDIPDLLQEATLSAIVYDSCKNEARISFRCLRRRPNGSDLSNDILELRIPSIERIAAYYDASDFVQRYSEIPTPHYFTLESLRSLQFNDIECEVAVNSPDELFTLKTSARIDWLLGEPITGDLPADKISFFITIEGDIAKPDEVQSSLLFQAATIEPRSSGKPLTLSDWSSQCVAWGEHWKKYWESRGSDISQESVNEDATIPSTDDDPYDPQFHPPDKPAFSLNVEEINTSLLEPVRDYHEGTLAQDWKRVARAFPDLDKDEAERARDLQLQFSLLGYWVYLRQIDNFWEEEAQACVTLRGVVCDAPFNDEPSEVNETVMSYCLRRLEDRWVIRSYWQGLPFYGSAPKSEIPTPWLSEWDGLVK